MPTPRHGTEHRHRAAARTAARLPGPSGAAGTAAVTAPPDPSPGRTPRARTQEGRAA